MGFLGRHIDLAGGGWAEVVAAHVVLNGWKNTLRRAGITGKLRPYDLRHNMVTKALEGGADIKALSEVVGSRSETLMKHYQHVTRSVHRKTVALIPAIGMPKKSRKSKMGDNTCIVENSVQKGRGMIDK